MRDEEIKECGCGSSCGCSDNHDENKEHNCGCGENHGHSCGCEGHDEEHEESFVVDLEDEDGNVIQCAVTDAFEFESQNYVLVENPEDNSCYIFRCLEEELVVPEDDEFERVTAYYDSLTDEE